VQLVRAATITEIGNLPGGCGIESVTAINSSGTVVGSACTPDTYVLFGSVVHATEAFSWSQGVTKPLGSLGNFSAALAVNNQGDAVGESLPLNTGTYAFKAVLFSGGAVTRLADAGSLRSVATAINDVGGIVGYSDFGAPRTQFAFVYTGGVETPLFTPIAGLSTAVGINNNGQIAANQQGLAYLDTNGNFLPLGTLGGAYSSASAVNSAGQVAGSASTSQGSHAFLYSDGVMKDLGTLGKDADNNYSYATGLNDLGQVVGYSQYEPTNSLTLAFLYANGAMIDLNSLLPPDSGWQLMRAAGINNSGQIAGTGLLNGRAAGFVLTLDSSDWEMPSVPEPPSLSLLCLCLTILGALRHQQNSANS